MTIKERKIVLFFLKKYQTFFEKQRNQKIDTLFDDFFSREELIEILKGAYFDRDLSKYTIERLDKPELLKLIGDDYFILMYLITKIEKSITASPLFSEEEKATFFENRNLETHYLYSKPTNKWDEYDVSNYYGLLWKHGKTKRVFAIFTSDVNEDDKYAVTTKPSFFFDTEDEAITEIENILKEKKFTREELKVMSLWQIQ